MERRILGLVGLFAVACGYSEKDFKDDYVQSYCAASTECAEESGISFGSESECQTFLGALFGLGTMGCDFDANAAQSCIDEIETADCDGFASADGAPSCDSVYSGASCGWGSDGSTSSFTFSASE